MIQHSVHVCQNSSIRPPRQSDHLNRSQGWSDWRGFTVVNIVFQKITEDIRPYPIFFSAGIHHLVLEQKLLFLRKNLIIGNRIRRLWQKGSSKKQYASLTEKKEDRIQRFSEWLQWRPLEDYRRFIRLLEKTKQEELASDLVASCKIYFN